MSINLNKPYVETIIDEDGQATIEAKNYVGPTCKLDTALHAQALYGPGYQGGETVKPEYHKTVAKPTTRQQVRKKS